MRTSTFLAVLAALMLLVACAAPVFGQSSSSSTGESSSSSAATIIASSSSSTGTSTNNNTAASSSSSSTGSNNGGLATFFLVFPSYSAATLNAQSNATSLIKLEIAQALNIQQSQISVGTDITTEGSNFNTYPTGGAYIPVSIINAPANAYATLQAKPSGATFINQATYITADQFPRGGAASTLSIGFAAVAVVLAALLQ